MSAWREHLVTSLRLHFRNRMALIYGYLFPLIFLVAFWVLYRHENVPLLRHMGELLTVSVLGGACFGLPTTLVSERERGVWRRYRLTPLPTWAVVASTAVARYVLVLTSGLLQLLLAFALGMTMPAHPLDLWVAFTAVSFAFIGLGLVLATLADTVPAVQALGQCLFLPMLIIGGVAVQLASLPPWAQHVSAFFPGRYAVEVIQTCVTGEGLLGAGFPLVALLIIGLAGCTAGGRLFRWDAEQRFSLRRSLPWLVPVVGAWMLVGVLAEVRGRALVPPTGVLAASDLPGARPTAAPLPGTGTASASPPVPAVVPVPTPTPRPTPTPVPPVWASITQADIAGLNYNLPPDRGVVAPFAGDDEEPDEYTAKEVETVRKGLVTWKPGFDRDDVQRVRNLLYVAAVPDAVQMPVERFLPAVVYAHLTDLYAKEKLIKILTYIAKNPEDGGVILNLTDLGIEVVAGDPWVVRERAYLYAIKMVARLSGRPQEP
ncbi:MAG: ABC transporter permease [Opitutaceae bacterium]